MPGGLFRSDDAGDTWRLCEPLWNQPSRNDWFGGGYDHPGIHSISVHPEDPKRVMVGISCGGVWSTQDGGETWETRTEGMWAEYMPPDRKHDPVIQDPHCLVRCARAPDALWVQHHNGVFKSEDEGRSWSELQPPVSSFGFATVVHPKDPKSAWFVPAVSDEHRVAVDGKLAVVRTRDGGESFDVVTEGLPQEHAYDLIYRHALDIDGTGDRLAFGSTTGSLWISENGGDSWQHVTGHLPPIYCVRFGAP